MVNRAYYSAKIAEFLQHTNSHVVGEIGRHHHQDVVIEQSGAWEAQCELLRPVLSQFVDPQNALFMEFGIPRMGKRADVVMVLAGLVFVLEFKVGAKNFNRQDVQQTLDYALDLKHFHSGSHAALVIPVLIATEADESNSKTSLLINHDGLAEPICIPPKALASTLDGCIKNLTKSGLNSVKEITDPYEWSQSSYKPTPTIVQAAQALYKGHDVTEISRSDAGAENLTVTADEISRVIERSKSFNIKSICFVTGVPGAGKTLAGLNIATSRMNAHQDEHAVFLSGNGPLVDVLREALARDEKNRLGISKTDATRKASTFIQNIHHFRDDNLASERPPPEKVAIFDEAQRAWDRNNTSKFMRTKRNQPEFNQSEPEFLIDVMNRHEDWCTVVALIGGGQEINTGEAGLPEWLAAIRERFPHWEVYYSSHLNSADYTLGRTVKSQLTGVRATDSRSLHLAVSVRSFRAETISDYIHALLEGDKQRARSLQCVFADKYPLYITRDLGVAKSWLRSKARGLELSGILASSGGNRLRPEGLNVKVKIDPANWFLNGSEDVRSCQYLEEVATEFDVQGLELDWACVAWDANLRYSGDEAGNFSWTQHAFKGTKWQNVNDERKRTYLKNSYRVLLTRARQGMVIFVPSGDSTDQTRPPAFYDGTYKYLLDCGLMELAEH